MVGFLTTDVAIKYTTDEAEFKPGKPFMVECPAPGSVVLAWTKPISVCPNHRYQVRYKTPCSDTWTYLTHQPKDETTTIKHLKSNMKYSFQVCIENNRTAGPYSESSDVVNTMETAASRYLELTYALQSQQESDDSMPLRRIPLDEIWSARNNEKKLKKFDLGTPEIKDISERTIVLLGVKGSGKRTFIDGVINYSFGVKWTDPYRFTLRSTETNGIEDGWTRQYCVNPMQGSRLNYKLNIIDTPSFDVDGDEVCQLILEQLRFLLTTQSGRLKSVDAVYLLAKAYYTQLYQLQSKGLDSLLAFVKTQLQEKIYTIATFADCTMPPVVLSLSQAGIHPHKYFPVNNAGLFVSNHGATCNPLSKLFWTIGIECFNSFFQHLSDLPPKPATLAVKTDDHSTEPVLPNRDALEDKIEEIQPQLVELMNEAANLKNEQKIVEENKLEIEVNAAFTYTIKTKKSVKSDLSPGVHVTNCLNCYVTCHHHCKIPRNEDKHRCLAMDKFTGNCKYCFEKCHWTSHANTPYVYRYEEETITKTYHEKEEQYRRAPDEQMTVATVLGRMGEHLEDLQTQITTKMDEIRVNVNLLRRISGRHDTMAITDQIDLLIRGEERKRELGYENRVEILKDLQKKM